MAASSRAIQCTFPQTQQKITENREIANKHSNHTTRQQNKSGEMKEKSPAERNIIKKAFLVVYFIYLLVGCIALCTHSY